MTPTLARSYRFCERLARRESSNFYYAFRLLPRRQRLAMCALYAFLRIADDVADCDCTAEEKAAQLGEWRRQFDQALKGAYHHEIHRALHDTVEQYQIPRQYLEDVLSGVEMDLVRTSYATFAELYQYCYRVASAVGLACIHIWGFSQEAAPKRAEHAGIAFQLTNILRDLGEDAARGRVYLPQEDLQRFDYRANQLQQHIRDDRFRALMRFQSDRTRSYYADAENLAGLLTGPGRAVYHVMIGTYRGLLEAIESCDFDVFNRRVRFARWRKLLLVAQTMPLRWGLLTPPQSSFRQSPGGQG